MVWQFDFLIFRPSLFLSNHTANIWILFVICFENSIMVFGFMLNTYCLKMNKYF